MPVIAGGAQAVIGLGQTIFGGIQARKARKALEKLQTPTYTPARSISDYYSEAKQRYNTSPYASTLYKTTEQGIGRNINKGISALQDRNMGIGGISSIIQAANDATLKAGIAAEQQQSQNFAQYGQAAGMMGQEERQAFNINQLMPYEKKYNLLAAKASGGSQIMNAGISNIGGGLSTYGQMKMADKYYSGIGGERQGEQDDSYGQDRYLPPSTYRVPRARTY